MNPALAKLFREGAPGPEAIDAFVAASTFPLIDRTDVTFVFRGDADQVYLRCWISGFDTAQRLQHLAGTDLWTVTLELPEQSRIEYKFEVVRNGGRELMVDSLNPLLARDPFGANSVCYGYRYVRPGWTHRNPDARAGSIEIIQCNSAAFGDRRQIQVYLPARFRRSRRYPLLIVHDGLDYLQYAELQAVLDNLMHALEIPEMVVALIQSPDRLHEYAGDDRHAGFLADELVPLLYRQYPLEADKRSRAAMGASFGAVASLHAAWRHPNMFGRLLLQSGSFAFSDLGPHGRGPAFDPVVEFMNAFRQAPHRPADRIYLSCGLYESLIYENRSLVPRLQAQGIKVRYEEVRDAHNWENWRDRLRNGLSWIFPGPIWMVYE